MNTNGRETSAGTTRGALCEEAVADGLVCIFKLVIHDADRSGVAILEVRVGQFVAP